MVALELGGTPVLAVDVAISAGAEGRCFPGASGHRSRERRDGRPTLLGWRPPLPQHSGAGFQDEGPLPSHVPGFWVIKPLPFDEKPEGRSLGIQGPWMSREGGEGDGVAQG